MTVPELPASNVHRSFLKAIKIPFESVGAAANLLKRSRGRAHNDPFFEGRKWAALRYLHDSDDPAAADALVRFANITVTIHKRMSKDLSRDPYAIAHRAPDAKRPLYETFGRSRGPEISGGATGMGRNRRG